MRKRSICKRVASLILAATVAMTSAFAGIGGMTAEAAAFENANLLVNADFEEATAFSPAGGSHVGNWFYWQKAAKTTTDAQSGSGAVVFTGDDSALEQDIDGSSLLKGMTYVYTVWAKASGTTNQDHIVGVKNYGGSEIKQNVNSTEWTKYEIEFVYTEGNPRVYGYVGTHGGVDMYIDNASVTAKSDIEEIQVENGTLTVKYADTYAGTPEMSDLSATYTVEPGDLSGRLTWTDSKWDAEEKVATVSFLPIAATPVEQTVTVNLSYGDAEITLEYVIEANGQEVVTANLEEVTAENGKITVALDADPTVKPVAEDFTWEYKVGDGSYQALSVEDFSYDSTACEVTVSFAEMRGTEAQDVTVKVTYNEVSKEDTFAMAVSEASIYYVDSTAGNDENDGLSPETAFASIDKLNTITFLPGDEILFKKGETFVGCFKPLGSGTETAPIKIGSYGEGTERPVLQPGEDWQVSHIMSADAMHPGVGGTTTSPMVNYVIQFYNVQYWEVSDLEIYDPTPQTTNDFTATYCSGITIQGEDIGVLEHFYIDNVVIHGFHGPGTNLGKTSGGITMNVITNKERDRSKSVPTQINDIRITNCEIYDVGRSGINFLTPWARRTEGKWAGSYGTGRAGYEYLPYEDFYLGNNYIHDVDGDGCIIDNCANAVVENNLVTRCVTRLHTSARMAVGLFNWNSDDTYFQFNEVYDIQIGGTEAYNDGQGIEIDALNDRTWVQYNYVHDNRGGFMMYCTVGDYLRGYDYIVRYNISQNDYAHPRQGIFDIYTDNYDGQIYNNTFYFTERALKDDQIFLFATAQSPSSNNLKFYNNIFYYDGETPKAANQFGNSAIDWQSNIFYGFTNLPENDNPSAPNVSVDPMLAAPGEGGTGTYENGVISKVDLSCYHLLENSPAINAGVPLADNGGRDYFGNEVTGIPDIGAYESGSIVLKAASIDENVVVSDVDGTVSIPEDAEITVEELLEAIVCDEGVTKKVVYSGGVLAQEAQVYEGDFLLINLNGEEMTYIVVLKENPDKRVIPVEALNAAAGDEHASTGSEGPAANVLDDNLSTIWHTDWYGTSRENHWIQLEVTGEYLVDGLRYVPRTSGTNGTITEYEILVSNDGTEWETAAVGEWAEDSSTKEVFFEAQQVKYVRLVTVNAGGPDGGYVFASAAELRLFGEDLAAETPEPEVTETPRPTVTEAPEKESVTTVFDDVYADWYVNYVQYVYDNNLMTGIKGTKHFEPNANITKAQVAQVLYNMEKQPEVTDAKVFDELSDVYEAEWYANAVAWAFNTGVVTGDLNTKQFSPNANVTREQLALMMYRYAQYKEYDTSASDDLAGLANAENTSNWALNGVKWAVGAGLISGIDKDGVKDLAPQGNASRAQVAAILQRFCENVK